jgi:hypothetical protein
VTSTSSPLPRLAAIDRSQILLRTVDVERLLDEDHSARSIWNLVGRLDLSVYYAQMKLPGTGTSFPSNFTLASHRSPQAATWNLFSDLRLEHLTHAL